MGALARLVASDAVARLVDRDPTLFSDDVDSRQPIMQRLGWTGLAEAAGGRLTLVTNLARAIEREGARDVVLLGMGGSSLTALVLSQILGSAEGSPRLHVLDSTSPTMVNRLLVSLERESTFFLVSSKSGTTIEPLSLCAIFRAWMDERFERPRAGQHFIAITDQGTPLEELRRKEFMRVALSAPPAVGGRFSALSIFGLAPAALIGLDLEGLVGRALDMERACQRPAEENPGALLAAWLVDSLEAGADKLTLVGSERYRPFGLWVEQLIAESTGKGGTGIVPVIEHATPPASYAPDRAVLVMRDRDDDDLERYAASVSTGRPVAQHVLDDPLSIGAEFVRWEYATALAGHLMGINPFDEPNVGEAKALTSAVLKGSVSAPVAAADLSGVWVTYAGALESDAPAPSSLDTALAPLAGCLRPGDYLTLLAYLPYEDAYERPLKETAGRLSLASGIPVCVEMGPRYLHSTGQLHKGGPDTGVFLMLTSRERSNVAIPGAKYSLAELYRAQAEGDLIALASHGRRAMRLDLPGDDPAALAEVLAVLESSVR